MDVKVREQLETKAKKLGFDSAQAYIRVWAKAEAEGRTINFGDDWGEPSNEAAERLNNAAEDAKKGYNLSGPFKTVDDFMKDL
jgi:nucleoside-diphosphate-sugar epimerase